MWAKQPLTPIATLLSCFFMGALTDKARADLIVPKFRSAVVVDFQSFAGDGFAPDPSAGQLDSDTWRVTGFDDESTFDDDEFNFGDAANFGDFARGDSTGGVSQGGVYAFETGSGNVTLGVQPIGADFTPGRIELRILNATGSTVPSWDIEYDIFVFNDEGRANSFNFSFSTDGSSFTDVPALDFTSPEGEDTSPAWTSVHRTTTIYQPVDPGGNLFLQWTGDDVSGSGSRDEFGLDNVSVTANPEPSSLILMSVGAAALAGWQHRRRKRKAAEPP